MTFQMVIIIMFRFINFALLLYAFVYIYKKYIRPPLVHEIDQENEKLKLLEDQKKEIITEYKTLEVQSKEDQNLILELKKKVALWSDSELIWQKNRSEYKNAFIKKLKEQSDFKELQIAEYMLKKESIAIIIEQSRTQLIKEFDEKKSYQYIQSVIEGLSKKSILS